jgi:hypothetical protein
LPERRWRRTSTTRVSALLAPLVPRQPI